MCVCRVDGVDDRSEAYPSHTDSLPGEECGFVHGEAVELAAVCAERPHGHSRRVHSTEDGGDRETEGGTEWEL